MIHPALRVLQAPKALAGPLLGIRRRSTISATKKESWSVATIDQAVSLGITDEPVLHDMATKFLSERGLDAPVTDLVRLLHEARTIRAEGAGEAAKNGGPTKQPGPTTEVNAPAATTRVDLTMDNLNRTINLGLTWLTGRCMRLVSNETFIVALRAELGDSSLCPDSDSGKVKTAINGWLKWRMKKSRDRYNTPADFENAIELLRQLTKGLGIKP